MIFLSKSSNILNIDINPSKSLETFFTLLFLIYSITICKKYEVNHLACQSLRLQSDDPGLSNSPEQADGHKVKVTIILDTLERFYSFNH